MKIGSPKNLEGKNLLVGVSAVDSNGNAIGQDITTLKNGANVTFTSSANGVLVIDARSVTSVENATSAVYATNDKNGNDISTTYQTIINDDNKLDGAYVSGAVAYATSAANVNDSVIKMQLNGVTVDSFTLNQGTSKVINYDGVAMTSDLNSYATALDFTIDNSSYVVSAVLKNGTTVLTSKTINLPLETMVVGADYDSASKNIKLTLKNGTVTSFSASDMIDGLVPDKRKVNGMALSDDVTLTGADIRVNGSVNAITIDSKISQLATSVENVVQECQTIRNQTEAIYESVKATVSTYYVGPAYNYGVTVDGTMLSFTWTDPADNNVVKWARTRLVMKQGGFPADENDGTALIDVTERNQHKTVPFTWDAGVISGYYFALFTQTTGGVWNTGDDCPRFTTDELTWATIGMMSRTGTLLQYPNMKIGSVVDKKVKDLYPKLRYMLADIDYSDSFKKVSDFMYDHTRTHNSIWIPYLLPSLGEGNSNASLMQLDAAELAYGETWDKVFVTGKAYYTVSGETYTRLTDGKDYKNGESVSDWETIHGDSVYSMNHPDRARWGYNNWKDSNMRQWLNSSGEYWFQKQNEYDVQSGSTGYSSGWLTDLVPGFLELVMPVYNKTSRNRWPTITGGGGGGYDITLDRFWLLSATEFGGNSVNDIAEGSQLAYFSDVAVSNAQRIQYDDNGVANNVMLRSPFSGAGPANCTFITTDGYVIDTTTGTAAANNYAFQPVMCI